MALNTCVYNLKNDATEASCVQSKTMILKHRVYNLKNYDTKASCVQSENYDKTRCVRVI